jgi:hypothetical protein
MLLTTNNFRSRKNLIFMLTRQWIRIPRVKEFLSSPKVPERLWIQPASSSGYLGSFPGIERLRPLFDN